jgi:hypothetical protein
MLAITALALGDAIIEFLIPVFWPLALMLTIAALLAVAMWAYDRRPGRSARDAHFARRHMVRR